MKTLYKRVLGLLLCLVGINTLSVDAQTLIKDIKPGAGSSLPEQLTNINGKLYFVADDGVHGKELWKSDGTEQGTVLVKDIIPGAVEGNVKNLTNMNGTLFFSAKTPVPQFGIYSNQLWKSDGTEGGTVELLDGQGSKPESKDPQNLTNVGGLLYYSNTLALGGAGYSGLLKSDGTNSPGTTRITYYPSEPFFFPKISQLTNLNGTLYFIYGGGLYKSTGTTASTELVKTIAPGPADNNKIQHLINVNGTLFFTANDGQAGDFHRLWKSDGTAAGTVKLVDGISNPAEGPNPANLTDVNGTLYYTSRIIKGGSSYWGLFKSNGSNNPGTGFFATFVSSSSDSPLSNDVPYGATGDPTLSPSSLINVNGTLYFVFANKLWKSNGTLEGTVQVICPAAPSYLTNVDGTLYFVGGLGSIFKTDPSTNQATSVYTSSDPTADLTNVNGTLFFTHTDPVKGKELYTLSAPPPPVSSALELKAPSYNCATGQFTFQTNGGNGSPIEFKAIGITDWSTNPNQYVDVELRTAADAAPILLRARQNGSEAFYTWDIRAQCPVGGNPPNPGNGNLQLTAPQYNCQTGAFTFQTSGGNGTPIEFRAIGITDWTTNPNQFVDVELRTAADAAPILLRARQNGAEVTYIWDIRAQCPVGGNPPNPGNGNLQLLAPQYNCQTGAFTFLTSGGNGTPIEFRSIGITDWTTNPNQFVDLELRTAADAQPLLLRARQSGAEVTYIWNIRAQCPVGARLAASPTTELIANLKAGVYPNPVGEEFTVTIDNAQDKSVRLFLTDLNGRPILDRSIHVTTLRHEERLRIDQAISGMYLLRVSTAQEVISIKVIKQ
ncbi:T9SS type A sorting domain-containing protein [Spirosoma sp. BT702]|uniref:T9SS type A sorting domain-containing protein n=1 Tax=Spirosoma profusum TaxID=2771354 RepID=A0A926XWL0_9BACT|nr:ELWxxDGT repeat protein [Spirosoma profusum]MBD2699003.1 T9SS type A sorting domain-containing protein [Spirosoma profusum]